MKLQHFGLAFIALSLMAVVSMFFSTRQTYNDYTESEKAEFELTSSLLDAMEDAVKESNSETYVFNTNAKRESTYNSFYDTLSLNLSRYATKDKYLKDYIPCIFMVDTDGFYVTYQEKVGSEYELTTTTLNTFVEEPASKVFIRYFLNDYVEVTNLDVNKYGGENHYVGSVEDVYSKLSSALQSALNDYLVTYEAYESKREDCIYKRLNQEINYYVNAYNRLSSHTYELQIPHTKYLNNGRVIDKPCIFGFMQGEYMGVVGTDANIFAYANSEIIDTKTFLCYETNGTKMYHDTASCTNIDVNSKFGGLHTLYECARKGYSSCPECLN